MPYRHRHLAGMYRQLARIRLHDALRGPDLIIDATTTTVTRKIKDRFVLGVRACVLWLVAVAGLETGPCRACLQGSDGPVREVGGAFPLASLL